MKCYTLSEKDVSPGVELEGLPVDSTLTGVKSVGNLKLMILFKERDGIVPDELLDEDLGRASACGKVIATRSGRSSNKRFLVFYDPRQWFVDPSCGDAGFVVYRSRERFAAFAKDDRFTMRRLDGGMKLTVGEKFLPKVESAGQEPVPVPSPEEGWFLATME